MTCRTLLFNLFALMLVTQAVHAASSTPLDISAAANSSFADQTPMDGKGGWTDQGANNDMGALPAGKLSAHGVDFNIINAADNNGKSCIALAEPGFISGKKKDHPHNEPSRISVAATNGEAKYIYLLHASGWTPDDERETGRIDVEYADGSIGKIGVKALRDSGNWWKPFAMPNAAVAWQGKNPSSVIGLYLSRFPLSGKPVKKFTFVCTYGMWFIAAASTSTDDIPMPAYTPPSFEYTEGRLAKEYPEFSLGSAMPQAMKGVAPLGGNAGTFRGCPALWLNGEWKLLPMSGDKVPAAEEIRKTDIFVPSIMGATKYYQKSSYQKQGKDWDKINRMWYSVNLSIPADWNSVDPLVLHFEAIDFLGAVFINGKFVKLHAGRFNPFDVTLPENLKPGDSFNLSVFVLKIGEAIRNGKCPFMQAVSYENGGITVPVTLYQDTPLRLRHIRVVTSVTDKKISITAEAGKALEGYTVTPEITPLSGQAADGIPTFNPLPANGKLAWESAWAVPSLWSPENPAMYRIRLVVRDSAGKETVSEDDFGFREVAIKGDRIILNGVPVRLFGLSYEPQGNGSWERSDEDFNYRYLMAMRKGLGINAVRFHHTPGFPAQLRAADRAGILVIDQSGLWTAGRFANYRAGDDFLKNIKTELAEWIWRDINHPSVIIWDTANEYICGSPEWTDFWMNLDRIVLNIDRTRIVEQSGSGNHSGGPMLCHYHNGACMNLETSKLPVIYGEFWISACGGKQPLTLPRTAFAPDEFNRAWLSSLREMITAMRMKNASGIFPFHQIEHSFRMSGTSIPASVKFAPSSFSPKKLNAFTYVNPYMPLENQIDPLFAKEMKVVFGSVTGYLSEGSNDFFLNRPAERHLYLANDTMEKQDIKANVSITLDGRKYDILTQEFSLAAGESKVVTLSIPAIDAPGVGKLDIVLGYGADKYECAYPAAAYAPVSAKGSLRLYGNQPELLKALVSMGYGVKQVDTIEASSDPLVIAENALDLVSKAAVNELFTRSGQKILILAQDNVNFADGMGLVFRQSGSGREGYHASTADRDMLDKNRIPDYDCPGGMGRAYKSSYAMPMPQANALPQVHKITGGTAFTDLTS
ncbi:MAG: hypothetical protein JXR97_03965, partial [Planctomycetes bacterium]|nr:hypothetical protein [Planctomycetota bacterium]